MGRMSEETPKAEAAKEDVKVEAVQEVAVEETAPAAEEKAAPVTSKRSYTYRATRVSSAF